LLFRFRYVLSRDDDTSIWFYAFLINKLYKNKALFLRALFF